MSLTASKVRVGVTGAVYVDTTNTATAPTDSSTALAAGFIDHGYVSEDGVTLAMPDAGDSKSIKAWQNGAAVRVIRSTTEDSPTLEVTFIETSKAVIETTFGVTVTQSAADGNFVINAQAARTPTRMVLDVIDGAERIRIYAPAAVVTSIKEVTFANEDEIGWGVTFDLQYDSTLGGNAKSWMTALKTGA